jgi:hypothetical protein
MNIDIFNRFIVELHSEFLRLNQQIDNIPPANNPYYKNRLLYLDPDCLIRHGQLEVAQFHPKIFEYIRSRFPELKQGLTIGFCIDGKEYYIEIRKIYGKILNECFVLWKFYNDHFAEHLQDLIKIWEKNFKEKRLQLEILIPLKGYYIEIPNTFSSYKICESESNSLSLDYFFDYGIYTDRFESFSQKDKFGINGIEKQYTKFCLKYKTIISFNTVYIESNSLQVKERLPDHSLPFWDELKRFTQILALEGNLMKFGKPYFKFPWWISQKKINKLDFYIPSWIDSSYFMWHQFLDIIPDVSNRPYNHLTLNNIFSTTNEDHKVFLDEDFILTTPFEPWQPSEMIIGNYFTNNRYPPKLVDIIYKWNTMKDSNQYFNFTSAQYFLDVLLEIGKKKEIEDVILYMCILLEGIFLKNSKKELKFRLKLFVASVLAEKNNLESFDHWMQFIGNLYDLRSDIIHGEIKWKSSQKQRNPFKKLIEFVNITGLETLFDPSNRRAIMTVNNYLKLYLYRICCQLLNILIEKDINLAEDLKNSNFINLFYKFS